MSKIKNLIGGGQIFRCPGCQENHHLLPGIWIYNNKPDRPTFQPSILFRSGHYVPGEEGRLCWCSYKERYGKDAPFRCYVCHSFVKDGQIQFLGDCTHAFAGQTVEIPDWPYAPGEYHGIEESAPAGEPT